MSVITVALFELVVISLSRRSRPPGIAQGLRYAQSIGSCMDIRPGIIALLLAIAAAVPAAAFLLTGEWLALGTFLCIGVIGVFFWYLFDGREPDRHASKH